MTHLFHLCERCSCVLLSLLKNICNLQIRFSFISWIAECSSTPATTEPLYVYRGLLPLKTKIPQVLWYKYNAVRSIILFLGNMFLGTKHSSEFWYVLEGLLISVTLEPKRCPKRNSLLKIKLFSEVNFWEVFKVFLPLLSYRRRPFPGMSGGGPPFL